MKAVTYLAAFALSAGALVGNALAAPPQGWSADLDKALEQAKVDNKPVLVGFTGSDWCKPCKVMRADVYSKSEFVAAASKDFILVEIDMPRGDQAVAKKNQPTVEKYKIDAFPMVLLLDAAGAEFARFYASEHPKVEDFLKHLARERERKELD